MPKQEDNNKIELYLIHGTLGSGKTSFIKNLSASDYFKHSYIIENEFANQNIDKGVLSEHFHHNDIIDISGGCVCCSTRNELIDALNKIREVNVNEYPVILETTGVANSVQLLKKLFLHNDFNAKFQLKRNILIIDLLENNIENLKNKVLDLSLVDTIVLNKVDLVGSSIKEEIRSFAKEVNNEAIILEGIKAKVELNELMDNKVLAESFITKHFDELISFTEVNHDDDLSYEILQISKNINKDDFESEVRELLKNYDIFRIKGYFKDTSEKLWHIEATKNNIEITTATSSIDKLNIIVIGKDIKNIKL